jgi:FkbM family methyltransferase
LTVRSIDAFRLRRRSVRLLGNTVAFDQPAAMRFLIEELLLGRCYAVWPPVRDNPVIIDAGANIGVATLYFRRLFPTARIISIEPQPVSAALLRANVGSQPIEKGEVLECALTGDGQPRPLVGEGITAKLAEAGDKKPSETRDNLVKAVTLQDVMANDRIDILKLDIEGAELEVIQSSTTDLQRVDQLIAEVHLWNGQQDALPKILEALTQANHRYELLKWISDGKDAICTLRTWRKGAGPVPRGLMFL